MATQTSGSGDFINNLGKIYGFYAGGFLAFVVFNAAVVFAGWEARSYFAIFFTTTLLVVLYDATTHPAIADDSDK